MKKILFAVLISLTFVPLILAKEKNADAEIKFDKISVGIVLGDPMGVTVKLWNGKETGFDAVLSIGNLRSFYVHADYILHNYEMLKDLAKDPKSAKSSKYAKDTKEAGELIFYYGGGAYLSFWNSGSIGIGARLPVGVEYLANPFDIYFELAPAFSITPSMGLGLYGGLGVRFNF